MTPSRSFPRGAGSRLALLSLPLLTGVASTWTSHGQEALQTAIQGDRSYQTRRQQRVESPMPHQIGPVGFRLGASAGVTYDDNVLLQDIDPQEDIIITPGVELGVYVPITDRTRLNFGIGVGYDIYTQNTREDRLTLDPNSEVAFDFEVGKALTTLYDRFSYSHDLLDQGEARSSGNYGGFNNAVGLRVNWVPEPVFVEAGYSWNLFISDNQEFSDLDRTSHQVFARTGQVLGERSRWGVEVTGSEAMYDSAIRSDYTSLSAGPFLELQVADAINLNLRGGWTWMIFDDNGQLGSPDDFSVPYASADIRHQLTAHFSHYVSLVREVRVGINSDYVESLTVRYGFNWQASDLITLNASAFYEQGEEPNLLTTEEYDRYGFNVGLPFRLTEQLSLTLGYQFAKRDSNFFNRDYDNNRANVNLRYEF